MKHINTFNEHVKTNMNESSARLANQRPKEKGTPYKFYKLIGDKWKYTETFYSTLDPEYHSYINWCKENNMRWKLVRVFDDKIMFEG